MPILQTLRSWFRLEKKDSDLMMPGLYFQGLSNYTWAQSLLSQLGLYAGTRINYAQEVGDLSLSSLIMAAVNWFGTTLPEASLVVQRPVKDRWETIADHPFARLWRRPNTHFIGEQYAQAIAFSWLIDGNVYFYKVRNLAGQVIELWYLPHFLVEPQFNPFDAAIFISHYLYQVNGTDYRLPVEDVVHIRRGVDHANPRKGLSVVKPILREVYADNEASNYTAVMFRNLGLPGFVIAPASDVTQIDLDARKEMREKFEREFAGDGKGKLMIASRKVDVHQLSFNPEQMMTNEARYISEERWAALTGIPSIVLGFGAGLRRSTYSNYEQAVRQAYNSFLLPVMRQIAPQLEHQLLSEFDRTEANRVIFDTSTIHILQEDRDALSKRVTEEWKSDLLKRADAKLLLSRQTEEGDDVYFSEFKTQFPARVQATRENKEADLDELKTKAKKKTIDEEADKWWDNFAPDGADGLTAAEVAEEEP